MPSKLPVGHEFRVGRHSNGVGFYAEIIPANTKTRPLSWEGVSHGHTSELAMENALNRFAGIPERLYEAKEFDL